MIAYPINLKMVNNAEDVLILYKIVEHVIALKVVLSVKLVINIFILNARIYQFTAKFTRLVWGLVWPLTISKVRAHLIGI